MDINTKQGNNQSFQLLESGADFRKTKAEDGKNARRLGNATELRTPPLVDPLSLSGFYVDKETGEFAQLTDISKQSSIDLAVKTRFELQDTARKTLYGYYGVKPPVNVRGHNVHHRTCTCTRFLLNGSNNVQLVHSKKNNSASFKGVMSCADAKTCPVCAEVINQRKANEMRTAFNQLDALDLCVSMVTFTAPHNAGDKIGDLVEKIKLALSAFWRGATATRFKKKYGYKGRITAFEVMHGDNGWHPHFHVLIFSKLPLPCTLSTEGKAFKTNDKRLVKIENQSDGWLDILSRWQSVCVNAGLSEPNRYGLDIQDGSSASSYITKFGSNDEILKTKSGKALTWDMADEITKGNSKLGRKKSLSPWGILDKIQTTKCVDERKKYQLHFLNYARATKGIALIKWARGTRALFDLEVEASDEEVLQQAIDKCDYLCDITPREWKYILANNLRAIVKQVARHGDSDAIARMLFPLYSGTFDNFLVSFNSRKNGTASTKDVASDWDLFDRTAAGDDVAILEKITPVLPVVNQVIFNESPELLPDDDTKPLIAIALDKLTKNRRVPVFHDKIINSAVIIDWDLVDEIIF